MPQESRPRVFPETKQERVKGGGSGASITPHPRSKTPGHFLKMLQRKAHGWIFVINNPQVPLLGPLLFGGFRNKPQYAVWQLERGENGTLHYQGYAYWRNHLLGSTVSRMFGNQPHLEVRLGKHSEVTSLINSQAFLTSLRLKNIVPRRTPGSKVHGNMATMKVFLSAQERARTF